MDRRKLAAWRRRVARQEASGLTVAAFCRQERVSVSLWKYWQRQVEREAMVVCVSPPVRPTMPFAAVETIPRRSVFLRFPGGATMEIPDNTRFGRMSGRSPIPKRCACIGLRNGPPEPMPRSPSGPAAGPAARSRE